LRQVHRIGPTDSLGSIWSDIKIAGVLTRALLAPPAASSESYGAPAGVRTMYDRGAPVGAGYIPASGAPVGGGLAAFSTGIPWTPILLGLGLLVGLGFLGRRRRR